MFESTLIIIIYMYISYDIMTLLLEQSIVI